MVFNASFYELLGVERNATPEELKAAYKKQSVALHPDKNPYGAAMMKAVNEAKSVLLDPSKRREYDRNELDNNNSRGHRGYHRHSDSYSSAQEVRRLREQLAESKEQLALKKQQLNQSNQKLQKSESKRINLSEKVSSMEYELSEKRRHHKKLESKHKKIENEVSYLKVAKEQLELENRDNSRQIDAYENKLDRLSRELREERRKSLDELAKSEEKAKQKLADAEKKLSVRSVCYQCDGYATSTVDCAICEGNGTVQGLWTKCHNCNGKGTNTSISGSKANCDTCSSKGAREGILTMTCFKCKGNKQKDCTICYKGKLRGFNLKLCPICNGREQSCDNCSGKAYVSCQCGPDCQGHGPNQISKPATPSSLQRMLSLGNGDEKENERGWEAKFFTRNWDVLSLSNEVKGVFI